MLEKQFIEATSSNRFYTLLNKIMVLNAKKNLMSHLLIRPKLGGFHHFSDCICADPKYDIC